MKLLLILLFSVLLISNVSKANAQLVLKDVVLVDTEYEEPFYIDIFETACWETQETLGLCSWGAGDYKPARMNFENAKLMCESKNMRLPTVKEWLEAASNGGRNKEYTLVGDSITDKNGTLIQVNISGTGTAAPEDESMLGQDAVGTIGMSANRPEWVIGENGEKVQCGAGYEHQDFNRLKISNLCTSNTRDWIETATSRCVITATHGVTVELTKRVKKNHKKILLSKPQYVPPIDDLLIKDDPLSSMADKDPNRLRDWGPKCIAENGKRCF